MRQRALTLPEVLITSLLFAILLVVVIGLQASMSRLSAREDVRDEARRNVNTGLAHLEDLLVRSRVTDPAPGTPGPVSRLRLQTGTPDQVDASGLPLLQDVELEQAANGDLLQRDAAGRPRRLASLGAAGRAEFEWLPDGLLRVTLIYARNPGREEYRGSEELLLPNQSP